MATKQSFEVGVLLQRAAAKLPLLLLLLLAALNLQADSSPIGDAADQDIQAHHLRQLVSLIKSQKEKPSSQLILDAYNEYVNLHKVHSKLADEFDADKRKESGEEAESDSERKYNKISSLLQTAELQMINQNLFSLLQEDYTLSERAMTPALESIIASSVSSLFD